MLPTPPVTTHRATRRHLLQRAGTLVALLAVAALSACGTSLVPAAAPPGSTSVASTSSCLL